MVKKTTVLGAYGLASLALVALSSSCGGNSNPAAPSFAGGALLGDVLFALPSDDLVTLKVPAPGLQSPPNNSEVEGLTPSVTISNPQPTYAPSADGLVFDFQVFKVNAGGTMSPVGATRSVGRAPGSSSTTYTVPAGELQQTTTYMWRSRARVGGEYGPWSDPWTFTTPTLIMVGTPTPISPAHGAEVKTSRPELIVKNGEVSANAGAVKIRYEINDGRFAEGGAIFEVSMGRNGTTRGVFEHPLPPKEEFAWRAQATNGTITSDWSETFTFTTTSGGNRTPDPPPGQRLPLPNRAGKVAQLASTHPAEFFDSCQEDGGSWDFMDIVVEELREEDTRWGYNCKRGNCNDVSLDVITYHNGAGPSDGSQSVYVIDIILGHCGPNPSPTWINQTGTGVAAYVYPRR